MENTEQNKQAKYNIIDIENRLGVVRGEGGWRLGEKGEGIMWKKTLINTDKSIMITRKEGGGER